MDIGCGCTGRFIRLIEKEGFTPIGIDVSSEMLNIARKQHPDIEFIQADICALSLSEKYDFITAWDSIWHVPLAEQRAPDDQNYQQSKYRWYFYLFVWRYSRRGGHTDDFMGPEVYYSTLGINGFLTLFIELGCVIRHLEYDQYSELHTYLIIEKV